MQLRKKILIFFIIAFNGVCVAQDNKSDASLKLMKGKEMYQAIYDSINHHLDALEATVGAGILFFRMELNSNGFANITCSQSEPALLIDLVSGALRSQPVKKEEVTSDHYDFLLPVIYNFEKSNPTAAELLAKVPKVDLSTLGSPKPYGFNKLFPVEDSSTLYGVRCVFLPWITLRGRTH